MIPLNITRIPTMNERREQTQQLHSCCLIHVVVSYTKFRSSLHKLLKKNHGILLYQSCPLTPFLAALRPAAPHLLALVPARAATSMSATPDNDRVSGLLSFQASQLSRNMSSNLR